MHKDPQQSKARGFFGESTGLKPDLRLHNLKQRMLQSLERACLFEAWVNPLLWAVVFVIKVLLLWPEVTTFPADSGFLGCVWWV